MLGDYVFIGLLHIIVIAPIVFYLLYKIRKHKEQPLPTDFEFIENIVYVILILAIWGAIYHGNLLWRIWSPKVSFTPVS